MTGNGDSGSFNTITQDEHDRHLGTLGMEIRLTWKGKEVYKDGILYATPIPAGIAAKRPNWLELVIVSASPPMDSADCFL